MNLDLEPIDHLNQSDTFRTLLTAQANAHKLIKSLDKSGEQVVALARTAPALLEAAIEASNEHVAATTLAATTAIEEAGIRQVEAINLAIDELKTSKDELKAQQDGFLQQLMLQMAAIEKLRGENNQRLAEIVIQSREVDAKRAALRDEIRAFNSLTLWQRLTKRVPDIKSLANGSI